MTLPRVIHVRQGSMRVETEPCMLRGVVATGVVIGVCLKGRNAGGLLHAQLDLATSALTPSPERLLGELARFGSVRGARGVVVGGADVLRLRPRGERSLPGWALESRGVLRDAGVQVTRTEVLDRAGRVVDVEVGGGRFNIRAIGAKPTSAASPPPEPEALAAPGRPSALPTDVVAVNMGCLEVAQAPARMTAILGSCVGIALLDPESRMGALAHVMMPCHTGNGEPHAKYADTAVPLLVSSLSRRGARPAGLVAYLAGGANVLGENGRSLSDLPQRNVVEARRALEQAGVAVAAEDVGGRIGRKMSVDLQSLNMSVRLLRKPGEP